MSSIINKRQQARNERILQDLLKSVAGNDRCADCGTKNPGWPPPHAVNISCCSPTPRATFSLKDT